MITLILLLVVVPVNSFEGRLFEKKRPINFQSINQSTVLRRIFFSSTHNNNNNNNTTAIKKKGYREKKSGFRLLLLLEDTHVFTRSCCTFLKENATDRPVFYLECCCCEKSRFASASGPTL